MKKIKNTKGYTLIELLIALSIIMLLSVLIYFTFAKVSEANKADRLTSEINNISAQMDNVLLNHPQLMSPDSNTVNFTKLIDTSLQIDPFNPYGYVTNYGGSLTISLMGSQGQGGNWVYVPSLSLEKNDLKPESCVKVAGALQNAIEGQKENVSTFYIYGENIDFKNEDKAVVKKEIISACAKKDKDNVLFFF